MNVGIIGCGNISTTYLRFAPSFVGVTISACADLNMDVARSQAELFGCEAMSVDDLLASQTIDLVVNLTVPDAHLDVSQRILGAGKHVYSEKPFVLSLAEGKSLQALAAQRGLRIGSAPDTFLGGAHQTARALIDAGDVGKIVGGSCFFQSHGMEGWHPNPDFFYQPGGGPMLDMGPYYLTNLVQLIGPVRRVAAMISKPFSERVISSEPRAGETLPVDVSTSVMALLEFANGARISISTSWDVWAHEHNCMELYGELGTLYVPDPNFFGGEVRSTDEREERAVPIDHPFSVPNDVRDDDEALANYRGAGLADMVAAIHADRPHRCSGELALHVVDIMTSILASGEQGDFVELSTSCERPMALDAAAAKALLATT